MLFVSFVAGITGCQKCGISIFGSKEAGLLVSTALCWKVWFTGFLYLEWISFKIPITVSIFKIGLLVN